MSVDQLQNVEAAPRATLVSGESTLWPWVKRNSLGFGIGLLSIVGAMFFIFYEPLVVNGQHVWLLSVRADLWVQWRAAGLLPNGGGYSQIFYFDGLLKTAPGWELLISPIAHHFLAWPFPYVPWNYGIPHPRAIWVAAPTELSAVPFCMCAVDVWLRRLDVSFRRRVLTLGMLAVMLPAVCIWGHPEDLMALGCALLAVRAIRDDRWSSGWWMGAALAFQVEAILLVPLCLVLATRRRRLPFLLEAAAVPLAVLAVPLIGDPHATIHALLHQSIFTGGIRYTPTQRLFPDSATAVDVFTLVAAVAIAVVAWRRRDRLSDASVLWLVGVVYCLRLLYPSLFPYYLVPAMAVFCGVSAISRTPRFAVTLLLGGFMTWWLEFVPVLGSWLYWAGVAYPLAVMAMASYPPRWARQMAKPEDDTLEAEVLPVPAAVAI